MAKKSYKPQDNELPQVNEPVAAYHVTTPNANLYVPTEYEQEIIMHSEKDYEEGRLHTQEDVDKPEERKNIINELRRIGRSDLLDKLYGKR